MPNIRHSVQISVPAAAIHPLISKASGLAQWWAADVRESGGAVEPGFFNRATVYRLRLKVNEPPSRVEWLCETGKEWSGTRLVFQLERTGSRTLLRFTHAGWKSDTNYVVPG